jgi:kinetochore protein NDC80
MEEEVPALFKRLRYPFGISRSALFAVGSPHTWPGLLAALVWLTELLCYEEKAVRPRCTFFRPIKPPMC